MWMRDSQTHMDEEILHRRKKSMNHPREPNICMHRCGWENQKRTWIEETACGRNSSTNHRNGLLHSYTSLWMVILALDPEWHGPLDDIKKSFLANEKRNESSVNISSMWACSPLYKGRPSFCLQVIAFPLLALPTKARILCLDSL
jgi:hypothetical protein